MKINLKMILDLVGVGMQVAEMVIPKKNGLVIGETGGATKTSGQTKQDLAVAIATSAVVASPAVVGILTENELAIPQVQTALREYIDATVRMRNVFKAQTGKDVIFNDVNPAT